MTDKELEQALEAIYDAYNKIRVLEKFVKETREKVDEYTGKESVVAGDYAGTYIDRVEDYIRGASATTLKNDDPELFARYGGKTSATRTLRVYKVTK